MNASPRHPLSRRQAFHQAMVEGALEGRVVSQRLAEKLLCPRGRFGTLAATLLLVLTAGAGPAWAAGCSTKATTTLLSFVSFAADFLIGVGAGVSVLLFAVGALFIMFGVTPRRVNKGMELIKQTAIGLAILASGAFIRFIVVDLVLGVRDGNYKTTC